MSLSEGPFKAPCYLPMSQTSAKGNGSHVPLCVCAIYGLSAIGDCQDPLPPLSQIFFVPGKNVLWQQDILLW